jgi:hypothetical protein
MVDPGNRFPKGLSQRSKSMDRNLMLVRGLVAAMVELSCPASAQWGYGRYPHSYGGYGWGGWGATAQGDIARGLGYFNMGAGIYSSALRLAMTPISSQTVRDIPYRKAAEAVTFSLDQFKTFSHWPAVLHEARFDAERVEFEKPVEEVRKDSLDDGEVDQGQAARLLLGDGP